MPLAVSATTFSGFSVAQVDERAHVRGEVVEQVVLRQRALASGRRDAGVRPSP